MHFTILLRSGKFHELHKILRRIGEGADADRNYTTSRDLHFTILLRSGKFHELHKILRRIGEGADADILLAHHTIMNPSKRWRGSWDEPKGCLNMKP